MLGQLVAESIPVDRAFGEQMLHRLMIDRVDFTHTQHVGPLRLIGTISADSRQSEIMIEIARTEAGARVIETILAKIAWGAAA